ncbi:MAG: hypothetical protein ACRECT_05830 [Thermoplasmata archaeon]
MVRDSPRVIRRVIGGRAVAIVLALALSLLVVGALPPTGTAPARAPRVVSTTAPAENSSPVTNFSASIGRLVDLLGVAGSGLLALVWARVALSWFSNDVTKKVQAKDRARDALVGTLLFVAAITGLVWGLAHWVLTGT